MTVAAANGVAAVVWTGLLYLLVIRHVWPWDLRGRRRGVVLKRGRRPWE